MTALETETATGRGFARGDVLVDARWLEQHLHDADLLVVEVDVSPAAYREGHIEGAVLWNIYSDLKDTNYEPVDTPSVEQLLARSGITPGTTVVFYGYGPAMGLWLMKLYGHADVRLLDCARDVWRSEGRPWSDDERAPVATTYPLSAPDENLRADRAEVEAAIGSAACAIVDVRAPREYIGERFWPSGGLEEGGRAGHVPSAVHVTIDAVRDEGGAFVGAAVLHEIFKPIGLPGDGDVITYCTVGGRACTAWFVLTYLLGRDNVRVYDGSWAQWGRLPSTPVDVG
jgi:thiosulfate/3-mercaptopyruvate sulfurtransferase